MKNVAQALSELSKAMDQQGMPNPKRQAEDLLSELLNCNRSELYINHHRNLEADEWHKCQVWLDQRLQGKPLAYLSGKVEFYNCTLEVNSSVLIPRPETEILVDRIVETLKKEDVRGKVLWDLCSGSGCMGIALKKALPDLTVVLSDISETAVELSMRNAKINHAKVTCLNGDFFTPFRGKKTDFLVCNPPYISESEYIVLDREVKDYEPGVALLAGKSGLEYYERLANELPGYLNAHGRVWLEIGYRQGEAVQELFQSPFWIKKSVENDWAGHHRFFFLEIE